MRRTLGFALGLLLASVPGGWSQLSTGNVYGTVTDESGAALPGATIKVSGATIGGHSTVAGGSGDFRFLNLDPGTYRLTVAHPGFTTLDREVAVVTGHNVEVTFSLKVATVEETLTINAKTPIVHTRKVGTLTTLSRDELGKVPSSRDPWAILRTIPGIVVDRVDIAGNESGQQSGFQGKGADTKDAMWSLDGLAITDMAAIGSSPTYFDFDAFDEISVSTGGNDLRVATGGIGLNFVTRRGTNAFHGSVHGYFTHHDLQATNIAGTGLDTDPRLKLPDGTYSDKADHIDQIATYGADFGGPIRKDRLWFWGSYGRQDVRNVRINQTKDRTILKDLNAKVNWQAAASDMVSLFYFLGAKEKFGRPPGWVANEPASFLWNQGNKYDSPLHGLLKIEDNHVFGANLFLNVKFAYYDTGFGFDPAGGTGLPGGVDFEGGTAAGSYIAYTAIRPQQTGSLDGNSFFSGMGGNHELKFGFGYRRNTVHSTTAFSGPDKTFALKYTGSSGYALVTRDRVANFHAHYLSSYLGDTFTKDRLTASVGMRWDRQGGGSDPSSAAANPAFPDLLPALDFDGTGQGVTWNDLSPRVGVTYSLDASRKTIARASYARYAGQLSAADVSYDSPTGGYSYLAYNWIDRNQDRIAQRDEILIGQGIQYFANVDPRSPASVVSPHKIDSHYSANIDNELIVGIDRELSPNLALSAAYTFRKSTDIRWWPRLGLGVNDYAANPPRTANGYTGNSYSPNATLVDAAGGGRILSDRPGYWRQYHGLELSLTKRLSDKWMARVAGSYMDWTERFEGGDALTSGAVQNPSRTSVLYYWGDGGPQVEGGQVAQAGKGNATVVPRWQAIGNALYQLPWGFEIAGSLFARQGFARPIVLRLPAGRDGTLPVLGVGVDATGGTSAGSTGRVDDVRYDALVNLDLRLAYTPKLHGATTLEFSADCFNMLNTSTVLSRNAQANAGAFNRVDELLSPRVFRFGLRLAF